jgi:cytochrome c-type biogenesis protein
MGVVVLATFSLAGGLSRYINLAAGIVVMILGLNVIFDFLGLLNYEKRFHFSKRPAGGAAGGFLLGAAFGAGWTPCIGPILGSILLLAAQSGKMAAASLYLAAYSLGLGLPFLGAAFFFDRFLKYSAAIKKYLPLIRRVSGALLLLLGLLICLGQFQALNTLILQWQYSFIDWAQDAGGPIAKTIARWLEYLLAGG